MRKIFLTGLGCESQSLESSRPEWPFVHAKIHPGLEGFLLGIKCNFLGEPLIEGGFWTGVFFRR